MGTLFLHEKKIIFPPRRKTHLEEILFIQNYFQAIPKLYVITR